MMIPPENPQAVLAKMALAFLERTDLKGNEVRSYVNVLNWLTGLSQPQPPLPEGSDSDLPPRPSKK